MSDGSHLKLAFPLPQKPALDDLHCLGNGAERGKHPMMTAHIVPLGFTSPASRSSGQEGEIDAGGDM
jgi:hypothetical protein